MKIQNLTPKYVCGHVAYKINHFKQNSQNYAIFSVMVSKNKKSRNRITQYDHIESSNRRHPGGVHFTLLADYTGRRGRVALPWRNEVQHSSIIIKYIKSVWDKHGATFR